GGQARPERQPRAAARAGVQRERPSVAVQHLGHAQQRGDADAAGEQQVVRRIARQREQVARRPDAQPVALAQRVRGAGAAARILGQQDAELVPRLPGRVAQRVLAHQAFAQVHVHVRARLERRQRRASGAFQAPRDHALRLVGTTRDADVDRVAHAEAPAVSAAIARSIMRRACTPPASMLSLSRSRPGWSSRLRCCDSSIARSSAKMRPWPSRMLAVSSGSSTLKRRAMPQKYQWLVSVSGVMKSTTMLDAFTASAAWWPPLPASATPTSIMMWLGRVKWQICQRSTGWSSGRPLARSAARQNGGARTFSMKRLVTTSWPTTRVVTGDSSISFWPMLLAWT